MTKRQARAYVLGVAASLVESDLGGGWVHETDSGTERDPKDVKRIEDAIAEIAASLRNNAKRLGSK